MYNIYVSTTEKNPNKKQPQRLEFENVQNTEWHLKHKIPENPTLEQRIKWHLEHARRCPCSINDNDILGELRKRYLGKHQDFWIDHNINDHKALGLWAAICAERLLPYFEEKYGADTRPRDAISVLREWVRTGEFHMSIIRGASLGAHAAAKLVDEQDKAANYAAHAAGQAVGTAHVPTHSLGVVLYSIRLTTVTHPTNAKAAIAQEQNWQMEHLPDHLKPWVEEWTKRTFQLLPGNIRSQLV
jgi:hypothetical protein